MSIRSLCRWSEVVHNLIKDSLYRTDTILFRQFSSFISIYHACNIKGFIYKLFVWSSRNTFQDINSVDCKPACYVWSGHVLYLMALWREKYTPLHVTGETYITAPRRTRFTFPFLHLNIVWLS